jgi:anti-sigma factor RsiW
MRLLRRPIVCQEAVELVTAYLEGALSRRDRRRFEQHLAECPHCTEYLAQMRTTIRFTGRITEEEMSPEAQEGFATLYRQWRSES